VVGNEEDEVKSSKSNDDGNKQGNGNGGKGNGYGDKEGKGNGQRVLGQKPRVCLYPPQAESLENCILCRLTRTSPVGGILYFHTTL
jgi:hypothetical protein